MYVSLVKTDSNLLLLCDREGNVTAFPTETEGIRYYEDSYRRFHLRSHESSMSACLNWMTYRPSILPVADTADIMKRLVGAVPFRRVTCHHVSGSMEGIVCAAENADKEWEAGTKPRLID